MEFRDRALVYGRNLVISDLHIGYERELRKKGINVPDQTNQMIKRIKKIKGKAERLIILGDLKHEIFEPKVQHELNHFMSSVHKIFKKVTIIRGNHDAGLEYPTVKELKIRKTLFIHGHALPKARDYNTLVMGHIHPVFSIKDKYGVVSEPCWFIGEWKDKKVIVLPSFNELISGSDYTNIKGPIRLNNVRRVLLDLTVV